MDISLAAYLFAIFSGVVFCFQVAMALGAPWGEWAMGGTFPGRFPWFLRIAAVFQALFVIWMTLVILNRANILVLNKISFVSFTGAGWVLGFCLLALVMNIFTRSKKERNLWAPVCLVLFLTSAWVYFQTQ